ncbi:MAG: cutinase family protein [Gordonia sp. (in: high G+C Gram-positive bacteria)]|uniref:cutinase family protein n=1 Tax=Gordonia sp. (in: high G+C Gram-positive bacteria) TaxID=84139 RepID=UPI0039E397F5
MKRPLRKVAWFLGALAVVAVILVIVLIIQFLKPTPPPPGPPTTSPPSSSPQRPKAQSADCPDVLVVSVPGTWESKPNDDPYRPAANPRSLMLRVTKVLQDRFPQARAEVYTVPYLAQFRNPTVLTDRQRDYNDSRAQGKRRTVAEIRETNEKCPLTTYVLMGFSQGAVIVGDIASDIGNGRGPIAERDQDLVLGVGLIADGRRQAGGQHDVGPVPPGVGAEIALGGFGSLVGGITMTGARPGGFGDLKDRTYTICAPGDLICDSPTAANGLGAVGQLAGAVNNPVHAMYATKRYWSIDGRSATQWMLGWSSRLIEQAPHPKHS